MINGMFLAIFFYLVPIVAVDADTFVVSVEAVEMINDQSIIGVRTFSEMPQKDKNSVIGGAIIVGFLGLFAAYLLILRVVWDCFYRRRDHLR